MVLIDQLEDSQAKPARRRVLEMSAERLELSTNGLNGRPPKNRCSHPSAYPVQPDPLD